MNVRDLLPAAGFALVWGAAAVVSPDTTFHLAPLIVASIPALRDGENRLIPAVFGVGLASAVAVLLSASGHLGGPTLLPVGGPLVESIAAALAGGALGAVFAGRLSPAVSDSRP